MNKSRARNCFKVRLINCSLEIFISQVVHEALRCCRLRLRILTRDRPSPDAPTNDHDASRPIAVLHFTHANRENFNDSVLSQLQDQASTLDTHSKCLLNFFHETFLNKQVVGRQKNISGATSAYFWRIQTQDFKISNDPLSRLIRLSLPKSAKARLWTYHLSFRESPISFIGKTIHHSWWTWITKHFSFSRCFKNIRDITTSFKTFIIVTTRSVSIGIGRGSSARNKIV